MMSAQAANRFCLVRQVAISATLASLLILSGCTGTQTQPTGQVLLPTQASTGVISSLRSISLHEDPASQAAALAPSNEGNTAIPPSQVSSPHYGNQGKTLSMVGRAVLGSLAGDNTDDRPYLADGQEVTVKLDGGGTRVVVQVADPALRLNQRVNVMTTKNGPTRVQAD